MEFVLYGVSLVMLLFSFWLSRRTYVLQKSLQDAFDVVNSQRQSEVRAKTAASLLEKLNSEQVSLLLTALESARTENKRLVESDRNKDTIASSIGLKRVK